MTWDRVVDCGEIMNHKIGANISVNMFHLRKDELVVVKYVFLF